MSAKPGFKLTEIGEIPEDWEVRQLKDLAIQFVSGGTPSTSNPNYWNGKIPWMRSASIAGMVVTSGEKFVSEEGLRNSATNIVPRGSLLVATRVSIGNTAVNDIDVAISQDLTGIVLDKRKVEVEYAYWVIKSFANRLRSFVQGSTIKGILRQDLENLRIPVAPMAEQRKISSILSSVDEAAHRTDMVIAKTQQLKKGLLQHLLTKGIGHNRVKKTEIGEIPEGWDVARIGSFAEVRNGATPRRSVKEYWDEGTIPWIPTAQVNERYITRAREYITEKGFRETHLRINPKGSILLAMIGQGLTRGKVALLQIDAAINQNFAAILPCQRLDSAFLFHFLDANYLRVRNLGQGGNQWALNCGVIRKIRVPVPPKNEQHEIATILDSIDRKLQGEFEQRQRLGRLKHSLMQVLLVGKVRVKVN